MATAQLNIGIIGAGKRAGVAFNAHRPQDGLRITAVADPDTGALDRFTSRYDLQDAPAPTTHTDYRALLTRPDVNAVFITSPDNLHEEHALAALHAGKAVYLEKPMAITIGGCDALLDAARTTGTKLYLGHNMRHMDFVLKMKELIDQGAIGEVKTAWCRHFVSYGGDAYFKDWHAERSQSTSLLLQKAAHDIDILHWLCGGYSTRVNAMGGLTVYDRNPNRHAPGEPGDATFRPDIWPAAAQTGLNPVMNVEDISMMQMELDNGVYACYQQCHFTPDAWRNYTVIGTQGRLENFGDEPGRCVVRVWNERRCNYNPYGDEQHYIPPTNGSHGGADPRIVDEFIRYVREGATPSTSPLGARNSVAAGCMATESLRNGGLPYDVPMYTEAGTIQDLTQESVIA